jgi:hypothetical protein
MKSSRLFAASKLLSHGTQKKLPESAEKDVEEEPIFSSTELDLVLEELTPE